MTDEHIKELSRDMLELNYELQSERITKLQQRLSLYESQVIIVDSDEKPIMDDVVGLLDDDGDIEAVGFVLLGDDGELFVSYLDSQGFIDDEIEIIKRGDKAVIYRKGEKSE